MYSFVIVLFEIGISCLGSTYGGTFVGTHVFKTFVATPADFETAQRICRDNGYQLPSPDTLTHFVSGQRENWTNKSLWMNLHKTDLLNWMTISGRKFGPALIDKKADAPAGQDCAAVHTKDKVVDQFFCNTRLYGYACWHQDGASCPSVAGCVTQAWKDSIMFFRCTCTWYQAYENCKKMNTSLATLSQNDTNVLFKYIEKGDHNIPIGAYFVGIFRTIWTSGIEKKDVSVKNMLTHYNWAVDEPHEYRNCAVMSGRHARWKAVECTEFHEFICHRQTKDSTGQRTSTQPSELNPRSNNYQGPSLANITLVFSVVNGVTVLIVVIIWLLWKHVGRKGERKHRKEGKEEETELADPN